MRVDLHQHIWTTPLIEVLESRRRLPFVRWSAGMCVLHLAGEAPSVLDLAAERPAARAALLQRDGLDRALIALSSPLGIEALPREESVELIDAHLGGVAALGEPFGAWGALALDGISPEDVDAVLARGCVGVSLPAGALSPPSSLEELHSVLARIEQLDAPLFIHPGPGLGQRPAESSLRDPLWWPALTLYVEQMQAAWLSFSATARRAHPRLRVIFAMLAGGAPLHCERLLARGGPAVDLRSPLSFYDTSSYGPAAVDALARLVGEAQLVYGSDRPVVEPVSSARDIALRENAALLSAAGQVTA
jgi:6-methylsalicylate decarboxylase